MFHQAYQLREFVNLWTEKYCEDFKITKIKLDESKWFMILLVDNLLNNHLEQIEKNIRSTCSSSAVIVKTCKKVSIKLARYYVKIKDSNETIYNLANILNSTMKLDLYKTWNNKDNEDTNHNEEFVHYKIKYKTEFKEYFHCYYKDSAVDLRAEAQRVRSDADKIMHYDNAFDHLLMIL